MALGEFWFFECSKVYKNSPDYKLNAYIENGVICDVICSFLGNSPASEF